jgi:signal transduction histidine kinase
MTGKPWRSYWLSASPARAVAEAVLLAVALLLGSLLLAMPLPREAPQQIRLDLNLVLLDGPVCALWCALRLRLHRGTWWRGTLVDGAIGGLLGLIPSATLIASAYILAAQLGALAPYTQARIRDIPISWFAAFAFAAFCVEFSAFRVGVRLWLFWDHLRRTQLRWALTHAHLMVIVLGAGLLGALEVLARLSNPRGFTTLFVPMLFFLAGFILIALLLVLLPAALFSYVVSRPTTRRLEALAEATSALRAGDYSIRVPVAGEDEVAQLQANFNAMAADLQRAVSELETQRDTVAQLLEARRQLVASVSHELRTPVATLRGYLESTLRHWNGVPPPTLRRDLEVMERETIHLQALINDLFALARAEVGQLDLRREPTDVAALARRVVQAMAPLAWQSGRVEVVVEAPADDAPLALADVSRLEQVLQNLIHNGVRHTPPGGIVAVVVGAADDAVTLQVNDTGTGIAPEDLPHIWERFYRAESSRARSDGGTGLGLALVKELTEAMSGTVAVVSTPGEGSRFTVQLPRAATGGTTPATAPRATAAYGTAVAPA